MKKCITLLLTPSQLAAIRKISIYDVFILIRNKHIPYLKTDDGIRIPVSYIWDDSN
ncbi:MAG: flagellar motor protein [Clostridia bacterium]|nr:flagellar motor protein [Clostridia bacterium]